MIHKYADYKRPTTEKKMYTDWKRKVGKNIPSKWTGKNAGVARFTSDKIDFKIRVRKRDPEGHFIILKGWIHQEHINIVKIYAPNIGASKYISKTLEDFEKAIDSNTLILGDFNTPLSKMDRSSKENINKDTAVLNNAVHYIYFFIQKK